MECVIALTLRSSLERVLGLSAAVLLVFFAFFFSLGSIDGGKFSDGGGFTTLNFLALGFDVGPLFFILVQALGLLLFYCSFNCSNRGGGYPTAGSRLKIV